MEQFGQFYFDYRRRPSWFSTSSRSIMQRIVGCSNLILEDFSMRVIHLFICLLSLGSTS